jgi:hypothetical protein
MLRLPALRIRAGFFVLYGPDPSKDELCRRTSSSPPKAFRS